MSVSVAFGSGEEITTTDHLIKHGREKINVKKAIKLLKTVLYPKLARLVEMGKSVTAHTSKDLKLQALQWLNPCVTYHTF